MTTRRDFLAGAAAMPALAAFGGGANAASGDLDKRLRAAAALPILKPSRLKDPVRIESVDLLRSGDQFFVRVRSEDGAEGICLTHRKRMRVSYPIFLRMVAPHFINTDARKVEHTVEAAFRHGLNYKFQGLAFWVNTAWIEFAVLDMLGKIAGVPLGGLIGERIRSRSGIYFANGNRESSAEEIVDELAGMIEDTGAKAVKHKLGARLHYTDESNARDKALAPLARKRLGDDIVLYADANGSFDYQTGLEMGRLLADHGYGFYEEPVMFDDLWTTKALTGALSVPVAGGEQETSMRRMRWQIAERAVDVHQPDLLFFGGLTRTIRAARMAEVVGRKVVPHMSGYGLGSLYVLHFASITQNTTPYQEWKGDKDGLPYVVTGTNAPLTPKNGAIDIPDGPGLGVEFDPSLLDKAERVKV